MLDKLAETTKSCLRKFKETKVYNYKYYILTILIIVLLVGYLSVNGESTTVNEITTTTALNWHLSTTTSEVEEVTTTTQVEETTTEETTTTTTTTTETTTVETTSKIVTAAHSNLIGRFKITVYCACSKCCGKYAIGRPVDKDGNVIVKGSSGRVLIPLYSIATDTRVIPSGKEVVINGKTYRADDTGGAVKGNVIDIYAGTDHEEAWRIACEMAENSQYADVYWK
jgi:3D (Asp-Asp-Asp) domain-containing protein